MKRVGSSVTQPLKFISVLMVDDHSMVAEGFSLALSSTSDIGITSVANSLSQALELLRDDQYDLVLLDYRLPDVTGVQAVVELKASFPSIPIVLLSAVHDARVGTAAIEAGAMGYLTKDLDFASLVRGIRDAVRGRPVLDEQMTRAMLTRLVGIESSIGSDLTQRELEILSLMERGLSAQQMSSELTISVNTARNHVAKVIYKLNVHSMREAVAVARAEGILPS